MNENSDYYVYVYIDPRNLEEFYYGMGRGNRRYSHLNDEKDSEKANRIKDIKSSGEEPIIRVIAANLTQSEAFLIETTLIWKLGRQLTNESAGHFSKKFRPQNTLHQELFEFDYQNGIFFVNVGEGKHRNWDDCRRYGFLSAGQGEIWQNEIQRLKTGDVVIAYLKRKPYRGYVGVGVVTEPAVMVNEFKFDGKSLDEVELICTNIFENSYDPKKSEYLVQIDWKVAVDAKEARWKRNIGLFVYRRAVASMEKQEKTINFVSSELGINIHDLLRL